MEDEIIIIGAGVAGLAAGCYAQMNGYRSRIFELHDIPGGLCTAWDRKGYIVDGCIHYLFGSGEGQPFNQVWAELGSVQASEMVDHEVFIHVQDEHGNELHVYADPDRLAAHMLEISPEDKGLILDLAADIKKFTTFDLSVMGAKPRKLMNALDWRDFGSHMTPFLLPLAKWGMLSAYDFAKKFKHPFLRRAVAQMFAWEEIPMMAGLSLLAYMHTKNAGYPKGRSLAFARQIEKRYLELGETIHYKSQVEKILVENECACGVRLYDDDIFKAGRIISAADGRGTLFDMLGREYLDKETRERYSGHLPIRSHMLVSLGISQDVSHLPHWTIHLLDKLLLIAGEEHAAIHVKHYCFDPSLAPPGHSIVQVMLPSSYAYWQRIYGRRLYKTEQLQVAEIATTFLDKYFLPGIRGLIEMEDVATPLSYERFTGNWLGSTCGWLLTPTTMRMMIQGIDKTLPGLEHFYMAGQWVEPGGSVPLAAMSGKKCPAAHLR